MGLLGAGRCLQGIRLFERVGDVRMEILAKRT